MGLPLTSFGEIGFLLKVTIMRPSKKSPDHAKANGVHYTPPDLAIFLADATVSIICKSGKPIRVLDPACGDGGLLLAIAQAAPKQVRGRMVLEGYETDAAELDKAEEKLRGLGVAGIILHNRDFR